jgi:Uma2 family endonuclease
MAATLAETFTPDRVVSFQIRPGTFRQFRDALAEGGPRLKCYEGSVTLVSPGRSHETAGGRLASLVLAICLELGIEHTALHSTTWELPEGDEVEGTAYEADQSYYVQSHGTAVEGQVPDLAIEVVVSNPETKALACGALLGIAELWVLYVPRRRLTFFHLMKRGKHKGTYRPQPRSRAFPFLLANEVLERLDDPVSGDTAFHENCRAWARRVLAPRRRGQEGSD